MPVIAHRGWLLPLLFAVFSFSSQSIAQSTGRDTIALIPVDVMPSRAELPGNGQRIEKIDSAILALYRTQNIASLLSAQSSVHVKSYGPGGIASTAFRGGNASQTAFVWNGINIQNYLLGQTDLSILPAFLFDEVQVEYGSSTALWGSGAVGGSILLNSRSPFNQGTRAFVLFSAGSYGLMNFGVQASYSNQRFVSSTKAYDHSAINNYVYDQEGNRARHGFYQFRGLLQECRWLLKRDQISLAAWKSDNQRQIPVFTGAASGSVQRDRNVRIVSAWKHFGKKIQSEYHGAFLHEQINFDDSLSGTFSSSRVTTIILEQDHGYRAGKHQFHAGMNVSGSQAHSDNYESVKSLARAALLVSDRYATYGNRLLLQASARLEYYSAVRLPFTYNASADIQLSRQLVLKANFARVFRQPVFNELFWLPGGNPSLRPEEGYSTEGSAIWKKQIGRMDISLAGSAFNRLLSNWIHWIPGPAGNAAAVNIGEVWSRGTETESKVRWTKKKIAMICMVRSAYVLSTVRKSTLKEDASVGRQLIYTPRYNGSASFQLVYKKSSLAWTTQYTGYRFTSSDNSQWLEPYLLHQVRISMALLKDLLQVNLQCNNIFNKAYVVVAGRPMPLRNFEAGLSLKINRQKNKEKLK